MQYRVLGIAFALLALAFLVSGTAVLAGDKNMHEGKVVSVKGEKLTMEGKNGKEHSHEVATTAKITCDGKACKLADLKTGLRILVTVDNNDRATRIQAFLKTEPPDPKENR